MRRKGGNADRQREGKKDEEREREYTVQVRIQVAHAGTPAPPTEKPPEVAENKKTKNRKEKDVKIVEGGKGIEKVVQGGDAAGLREEGKEREEERIGCCTE
ncbi:hypothetical protein K435DRAFT_791539 [Dendrothele bispora CBS 962.96]|uniref:Uncharacterized protein n=1 Tax=Dendrothele bispora (strain CBS 962.96) TaxID=1314807 RepID=A0A4V4HHQ6_DENBC|nr:hypothetical protein K435DRAFT_791539 [Dendrothele bispora CBS 962.96]